MPLLNSITDNIELYLTSAYNDGDATLDLYVKNNNYSLTDQKTGSLIESWRGIVINKDNTDEFMSFAINGVVANGTINGMSRYIATFRIADDSTTKMVGLANTDDGTDSVDNVISANKITYFPVDSMVLLPVNSAGYKELIQLFDAGSTINSGTAGENIS
jgi:hypothetical protein